MSFRLILGVFALASLPACNSGSREDSNGNGYVTHLKQMSWEYMTGTATGIAMIRNMDGENRFVLSCKDFDFQLFSSELKPLNQWPQPEFALAIDSAKISKIPDVLRGNPNDRLAMSFKITQEMLAAIKSGNQYVMSFGKQSITFPAPPEQIRSEFATQCANPNSPAM